MAYGQWENQFTAAQTWTALTEAGNNAGTIATGASVSTFQQSPTGSATYAGNEFTPSNNGTEIGWVYELQGEEGVGTATSIGTYIIQSGTWTFRWDVTSITGSNTISAIYIEERTSAGVFYAIASATGLSISLNTLGSNSTTVSQGSDYLLKDSESTIYVYFEVTNADGHGTTKVTVSPDVLGTIVAENPNMERAGIDITDTLAADLAFYLKLDETTGTTLQDISNTDVVNSGTLGSGGTLNSTFDGETTVAVDNSVGTAITISDDASWNNTTSVTWLMWFAVDEANFDWNGLGGSGYFPGLYIEWSGWNDTGYVYFADGTSITFDMTPFLGTSLACFAITADAVNDDVTVYVNGTSVGTGTLSGSGSLDSGIDFFIVDFGYGASWTGNFARIAWWNRELTSSEISTLSADIDEMILTASGTVYTLTGTQKPASLTLQSVDLLLGLNLTGTQQTTLFTLQSTDLNIGLNVVGTQQILATATNTGDLLKDFLLTGTQQPITSVLQTADLDLAYDLTGTQQSLIATAQTGDLSKGYAGLTGTQLALAITTQTADLLEDFLLTGTQQTLTAGTNTADIFPSFSLTSNSLALTVNANTATLLEDFVLNGTQDVLTVGLQTADLQKIVSVILEGTQRTMSVVTNTADLLEQFLLNGNQQSVTSTLQTADLALQRAVEALSQAIATGLATADLIEDFLLNGNNKAITAGLQDALLTTSAVFDDLIGNNKAINSGLQLADLTTDRLLEALTDALSAGTNTADLDPAVLLEGTQRAVNTTLQSAELIISKVLESLTKALAVTLNTADLTKVSNIENLTGNQKTMFVGENDADLDVSRLLEALTDALTSTGNTADLNVVGILEDLTATIKNITVTKNTADVLFNRMLEATQIASTASTNSADLLKDIVLQGSIQNLTVTTLTGDLTYVIALVLEGTQYNVSITLPTGSLLMQRDLTAEQQTLLSNALDSELDLVRNITGTVKSITTGTTTVDFTQLGILDGTQVQLVVTEQFAFLTYSGDSGIPDPIDYALAIPMDSRIEVEVSVDSYIYQTINHDSRIIQTIPKESTIYQTIRYDNRIETTIERDSFIKL